ncbi:MAG: TAT-variant-translocated molybdopterin oxidoreductase, partial [Verrucomicrobiota bacterium]
MKRKFQHPEPTDRELAGPRYWRSPDELADTPEFRTLLEREFPEGASESTEADRRTFLKLMGASAALAGFGLAGCRQPKEYILPYSKQPERIVQGVPIYYASSQPASKGNIPLVVETHDARPTKIEGNPSYTPYGGGTDSYAQASVLDLYDPDRLQQSFSKGGKTLTQAAVLTQLTKLNGIYAKNGGKGLAFLAEPSTSPTRARLVAQLKKAMPDAVWAEYEAIDTSNPDRAAKEVLGKDARPVYDFAAAKRILAIDADFLCKEPGHLGYSRGFAKGRKVKSKDEAKKMNRLYAVESEFSITGGQADHRKRLATSHMAAFTALVLAEVIEQTEGKSELSDSIRAKAEGLEFDSEWLSTCVADLVAHAKKHQSVVIAGSHLPVDVHVLVLAINDYLDGIGHTVDYLETPAKDAASLTDLSAKLEAGEIDTLVILGGNPAYDTPGDLDWVELQSKAKQSIRYGYYGDETSELSDLNVAANHYLESWGDGLTLDGIYVPVQPMILPLFDGLSELEFLDAIVSGASKADQGYGLVRATFAATSGQGGDVAFHAWLTEGVLAGTGLKSVGKLDQSKVGQAIGKSLGRADFTVPELGEQVLEVRITPSSHFYDGRYNNNGWMAEAPDPMTKLTWDNVISVGPKLAKALGITPDPILMDKLGQLHMNANKFERGKETAPMGTIKIGETEVTGPLHVQPGLADYTVLVTLGFGRRKTGRIGTRLKNRPGSGNGAGIGFDAYPLTTLASPGVALGATITVLEETFLIANTQQHWSMEGRAILREGTNKEFIENTKFAQEMGVESHAPPNLGNDRKEPLNEVVKDIPRGGSLYKTPDFEGTHQWGMAIDLNSCLGCNACVVACQSENNIPIVGKDQVLRGRELHWIRMDRYYSTGPDHSTTEIPEDPQVSFMGVSCQHCELAPCESVCPVNATVHDEEGLNVMAYNRCVGTRYCANNCPYKVRRFNFFDYNKRERGEFYKGPLGTNVYKTEASQVIRMQKNPNVTVRMRGVMEK